MFLSRLSNLHHPGKIIVRSFSDARSSTELTNKMQGMLWTTFFDSNGEGLLEAKDHAENLLHRFRDNTKPVQGEELQIRADGLNAAGYTFTFLREYTKAYNCHVTCLQYRERVSEQPNMPICESIKNVGFAHLNLGEPQAAMKYFDRAAKVLEQIEAPSLFAYEIESGKAVSNREKHPKIALESALKVRQGVQKILNRFELQEKDGEEINPMMKKYAELALGIVYRDIGNIYFALGDVKSAADYYTHSCNRFRKEPNGGKSLYLISSLVELEKVVNLKISKDLLQEASSLEENLFHGTPNQYRDMLKVK